MMLALGLSFGAKAQQGNLRFYYYPSSNVYYDVASQQYYYDPSGSWVTVKQLPAGYTVVNQPRYVVYRKDHEIWRDNAVHVQKYKNKPNGKAKGWKGSNENKAKGKERRKD